MSPRNSRAVIAACQRSTVAALAAAVVLSGSGLAGCGVVTDIRHTVAGNRATIDAFTGKLKSGATTFAVTYVTTGSSPSMIVYAAQPPNRLAFKDTPGKGSDDGKVDIVVNSSGEYFCTPRPHSRWSCRKQGKASAAVQNKVFGFYTPAHWIEFLKGFALAAGFAGDKITTSSKTVNGFSLQCVDFRATGSGGKSSVCSTAQGILGYVKIAGDSTSFRIKAYTTAPPAALFSLPPRAKVTR
jgi:hypothetical protein